MLRIAPTSLQISPLRQIADDHLKASDKHFCWMAVNTPGTAPFCETASRKNTLNDDTVQHNVSIYESEGGADLFTGDIIAPGGSTTYIVPALEKGELHFQCDLHPSMAGTVTVE